VEFIEDNHRCNDHAGLSSEEMLRLQNLIVYHQYEAEGIFSGLHASKLVNDDVGHHGGSDLTRPVGMNLASPRDVDPER
jgi:hypothetical protein